MVDAGPRHFRSDEDRFEVLSDEGEMGGEDLRDRERSRKERRTREETSSPVARETYQRGPQTPHEFQPHPYTAPNPDYYSSSATDHTSGTTVRPKIKRSSTSASQALRRAGTDLLQNLPALLERAGWLIRVLEAQQSKSRKRSLVSKSSALMVALSLVSGLYKQYNERKSSGRDGREHRERRAHK